MPEPSLYEKEYSYWPWGKLMQFVADWIAAKTRRSAMIMDYMCGTGFLLNQISLRRPDLRLEGCSLDEDYIDYANLKYPTLNITFRDAMEYSPSQTPDVVICTAGLHHLETSAQSLFIEKLALELRPGGVLVIGEELIAPYSSEQERQVAVLHLGTSIIRHLIDTSAPMDMMQTALDVLANDIEGLEYKTDSLRLRALLAPSFEVKASYSIWPEPARDWGDYVFLCERK
jgi:2-polyprenyl-3-methyl-5-hydroxy-6-metoxy-1,4-benzoquinol methylase